MFQGSIHHSCFVARSCAHVFGFDGWNMLCENPEPSYRYTMVQSQLEFTTPVNRITPICFCVARRYSKYSMRLRVWWDVCGVHLPLLYTHASGVVGWSRCSKIQFRWGSKMGGSCWFPCMCSPFNSFIYRRGEVWVSTRTSKCPTKQYATVSFAMVVNPFSGHRCCWCWLDSMGVDGNCDVHSSIDRSDCRVVFASTFSV